MDRPHPIEPSRRRGLERLATARTEAKAKTAAAAAIAPRFHALAREDAAPVAVAAWQLFPTPPAIAARMAAALGRGRRRILEPSAGTGNLYRAARAAHPAAEIVLVDVAADCCRALYQQTEGDVDARLFQRDFLATTAAELGGPFDAILINPPFNRGADIQHIRHAAAMLAPGGRLVALCLDNERRRRQIAADAWEQLPPRSFREVGTAVDVAALVIERGADA